MCRAIEKAKEGVQMFKNEDREENNVAEVTGGRFNNNNRRTRGSFRGRGGFNNNNNRAQQQHLRRRTTPNPPGSALTMNSSADDANSVSDITNEADSIALLLGAPATPVDSPTTSNRAKSARRNLSTTSTMKTTKISMRKRSNSYFSIVWKREMRMKQR